jgi:hypothetical protein
MSWKLQAAVVAVLILITGMGSHAEDANREGFEDAVARVDATLEAVHGKPAARRLTPQHEGSVRLVGRVHKRTFGAEAEFRVLVDSKPVWRRALGKHDSMPHAFDIVAYDLAANSSVELVARVGPESKRVELTSSLQVVPEPFVTRWREDLPAGYPTWNEDEKKLLRKKGQDILQAIRDASAAKKQTITIPPGAYLFHADWSRASTLADLKDLEIIARGVTFWFEPPMVHGLLFERCRNVTVRGLTIDFTIPCWFQATVTAIDLEQKTLRAELMPGYPPRNATGLSESKGDRAFMFYDRQGRFINHRHTPTKWQLDADGKTLVCRPGRSGIPKALKPGDYVVGTIRTGAALRSRKCERMRFEDVNIWSSPGMAVYEGGGKGGHVYQRVRATRRPHTNRLQAFGADIFHLAGTDNGPKLERCELAYGADDNLNIHGSFGRVVKKVDRRRYYLDGIYEVGDAIEVRDGKSVDLLGLATVVSVKATPDGPSVAINEKYKAEGRYLVELDKALDLPPLSLVVLDGKRSADGFVLRNCWLHDNFQRTLINGSPNGLIENNTLQNVGMGICIQFETWGPWMEGPFARNLVIRNNRFIDASPVGAAINVSMHPAGGGSNVRRFGAKPVTNMTITGNYFGRTAGIPIYVHNVDGLKIRGNSVDHPPDAPVRKGLDNESPVNWLYLQDCENVSVQDNMTPGMLDQDGR